MNLINEHEKQKCKNAGMSVSFYRIVKVKITSAGSEVILEMFILNNSAILQLFFYPKESSDKNVTSKM